MIGKNFDDISKADIDLLINNKISEMKTLEYKEQLPGRQDSDKKEFLADMSSFANSSGGDVIYGIKEAVDETGKRTGEPEVVVPIQGVSADEAKLWIENLVRTGIEPRIRIHVKEVSGYGDDDKEFVIVIRISQSFASPHMVKFGNTSRFFCRNSAGKYQLDVQEIRNAFLATDSQAERIRSFLQNRLAKIMADETPLRLSTPHRLVLHILPLNSFLNQKRFELSDEYSLASSLGPIVGSGWDHTYNLDGFMTYSVERQSRVCKGYCQIYFDGTIEAVHANILRTENRDYSPNVGPSFVYSTSLERSVVNAVTRYIKVYQSLDIDPPIIVSAALLGCKGAHMSTNYDTGLDMVPLDRDVAILPQVQIGSFEEGVPTIMKPLFDALWNAFGLPRSYNYTENGIWNVR